MQIRQYIPNIPFHCGVNDSVCTSTIVWHKQATSTGLHRKHLGTVHGTSVRALLRCRRLRGCQTWASSPPSHSQSRRTLLSTAACACPMCLGRLGWYDRYFAWNMAFGMKEYEDLVAPHKQALFERLTAELTPGSKVLELGIGTAPNLEYYTGKQLSVLGVDPNPEMQSYAYEAAELVFRDVGDSLTLVQGTAEQLPAGDGSMDAVVCTLVLCSVKDVNQVLAEVRRVLKPGGVFAFIEHVYAADGRTGLQLTQKLFNPLQQLLADGCHLDRQTLRSVQAAGFSRVDASSFDVEGLSYLAPHIAGLAYG